MIIRLIAAVLLTCALPNSFAGEEPDSAVAQLRDMFESDRVEFVWPARNGVGCDPILCGGDTAEDGRGLRDLALDAHIGERWSTFLTIPDEWLPPCQQRQLRDTAVVLWSEGAISAVVAGFVYVFTEGDQWPMCELEPLDSADGLPEAWVPALVFRDVTQPYGSIQPHRAYDVSDEDVSVFLDAVRSDFAQIPDENYSYRPSDDIEVEYWGVRGFSVPDTLIASVVGAGSFEYWRWHAAYMLTKEDNDWVWHPLIELHRGPIKFAITCTLDLNGDGSNEYLVYESPYPFALYTLVDDKLVRAVMSDFRGD